MKILVAKNSGFCFGVKRAVDTAFSLGEGFVLGEIIHNESVNEKLSSMGVITINSLDDIPKGDIKKTLMIRTHGEPEITYKKAEELGLNLIDGTCPFVKNIQDIVRKHYSNGYKIAVIGKPEHPEIIGINGWCNNTAIITEDPADFLKGLFPLLAERFLRIFPNRKCRFSKKSVLILKKADIPPQL